MNPTHDDKAAPVRSWLAAPIDAAARQAIERVRRADDVAHVAVMPDVHLATDVCVGTAMATNRLVYPSAVGGDIGCGMLALAFDASADVLRDPHHTGSLLHSLGRHIPSQRHNRSAAPDLPAELRPADLSYPSLQHLAAGEGRMQMGTLGSGNHFVEFQADEDDRLWLMIHSGSRAMGQAVRAYHVTQATLRSASMLALDADSSPGQAYLNDQEWCRRYAAANRASMARQATAVVRELFGIRDAGIGPIACDHNHVCREEHFGQMLLVHRKGAMPADAGLAGVVPGSMGTSSFHVEGRGCAESLRSSAHGAGRAMPRSAARRQFSRAEFQRQMSGVWFDPRLGDLLREESPRSYKDIGAVMRAQAELVKVTRKLRPLLVYKGR